MARRRLPLILACGLAGAVAAYSGAHLLTPKYLASAQIFIDPGSAKGGDSQPIALGQDSNGFVNYVESQALIVNSLSVMTRVVRALRLERDPVFGAAGGWLGAVNGAADPAASGDPVSAAARALSLAVQVKRPERTFVLDISVNYRDPVRAAEIANAVAQAYIDENAQLLSDAARQTSAAIAEHLETLRDGVLKSEKAIEDYKSAKGLIGAGDTSLVEQQLRQVHDQIVGTQARASEAKARADAADALRRNGGDLGAFASQFGIAALTPLRSQQAEARQKLADALAELGPRHPQAINAQAAVTAANAAVDGELQRFAASQRLEFQRAKALETDLTRQLESLKNLTNIDSDAMIGLRDLERKAAAARDVYELFVGRSRETGEIQQIEPARVKIISSASPPKSRVFPPSAATLAGLGFAAGLAAGFALALALGGFFAAAAPERLADLPVAPPAPTPSRRSPELPPETPAAPDEAAAAPARMTLGAMSALRSRHRMQSPDSIDLADLGFPAMTRRSDASEFGAVLDAAGFPLEPPTDEPLRFRLVVTGSNDDGLRSALAINLALAARRRGARVALIDGAGRNAKLTRAVRLATRQTALAEGAEFQTVDQILLVLPKVGDTELGRLKPLDWLKLLGRRGEFDLLICDGPEPTEVDSGHAFAIADAIAAVESRAGKAALEALGVKPAIWVQFEPRAPELRAAG